MYEASKSQFFRFSKLKKSGCVTFKITFLSIFICSLAFPGTESMGKPWKNHGKSMGKIPWIPLKTMEHGAGAKFHGFHGEIPMLSMLAWDSKNCKITPHESMESME